MYMCVYVCVHAHVHCVHVCPCTLGWILLLLNDTGYVRVTFPAGGDLGGSTSYASIFLYDPEQVLLPSCSLYGTFYLWANGVPRVMKCPKKC